MSRYPLDYELDSVFSFVEPVSMVFENSSDERCFRDQQWAQQLIEEEREEEIEWRRKIKKARRERNKK